MVKSNIELNFGGGSYRQVLEYLNANTRGMAARIDGKDIVYSGEGTEIRLMGVEGEGGRIILSGIEEGRIKDLERWARAA